MKFPTFSLFVVFIICSCSNQVQTPSEHTLKTDFSSCDESKKINQFYSYNSKKLLEKIDVAKFCNTDKQCVATDLPQQFGGCTIGLNVYLSGEIFSETKNYVEKFCSEPINKNCKPPTVSKCIKNRCVSNGDL